MLLYSVVTSTIFCLIQNVSRILTLLVVFIYSHTTLIFAFFRASLLNKTERAHTPERFFFLFLICNACTRIFAVFTVKRVSVLRLCIMPVGNL